MSPSVHVCVNPVIYIMIHCHCRTWRRNKPNTVYLGWSHIRTRQDERLLMRTTTSHLPMTCSSINCYWHDAFQRTVTFIACIVKWLIYLIVVLLWHLVLIKFGSSWHKILRSDCFYHWKSVYKAHDECCKNLLIRCCDAALFEWTSCSCSIFHNVSTSTGCKLSLQLYWLVVVTVLLWEN